MSAKAFELKSLNSPDEVRRFEKGKVVGDEPVVFVDFQGMVDYAKQRE